MIEAQSTRWILKVVSAFGLLVALLESCSFTATAQQVDAPKSALRVADAVGLDLATEATLARLFSSGNANDFELLVPLGELINSRSVGLVPIGATSADSHFAVRAFQSGRLIAAECLLKQVVDPRQEALSPTNDLIATPTLPVLEKISATGLASKKTSYQEVIRNVDVLLEAGWAQSARELLYACEPTLRYTFESHDDVSASSLLRVSIPWYIHKELLQAESSDVNSGKYDLESLLEKQTAATHGELSPEARQRLAGFWMRLVYCAVLEADTDRFDFEQSLVSRVFGSLEFKEQLTVDAVLSQWKDQIAKRLEQGNALKFTDETLNAYREEIFSHDFLEQNFVAPKFYYPGYPPAPLILDQDHHGPMVLVRRGNQAYAWSENTSSLWPTGKSGGMLYQPTTFDSSLNIAGESMLGGMATDFNLLLFLQDTQRRSSAASTSLLSTQLVAVELSQDAALTAKTPIGYADVHPGASSSDRDANALTFIGTPLIDEQKLYVLASDLGAGVPTFQVLCFALPSLDLLWSSKTFGKVGARLDANELPNSCLVSNQGKLFVGTGHGCLAAVQVTDGEICFQVNYEYEVDRRFEASNNHHRRTTLVPYRDTIVCCTSDAPSIFAVDRTNGQLIWSVDSDAVQRNDQLVGVADSQVLCLGDRIAWLNAQTGRLDQVVELPLRSRVLNGQTQIRGSMLLWNSGESIYGYPLQKSQPADYYVAKLQDLDRWEYVVDEPFAFAISDRYLSIVSPSQWRIYRKTSSQK